MTEIFYLFQFCLYILYTSTFSKIRLLFEFKYELNYNLSFSKILIQVEKYAGISYIQVIKFDHMAYIIIT